MAALRFDIIVLCLKICKMLAAYSMFHANPQYILFYFCEWPSVPFDQELTSLSMWKQFVEHASICAR